MSEGQHYLDSVVGKEHESGREILRKDLEHGVAEGENDQNSLYSYKILKE